MKKVISNIFIILIILLIIPTIIILVDSVTHPNKIPGFFGYKPLIVVSGSMEDEFYAGDLVIVREIDPEDVKVDDVVAFLTKDDHAVVTHRIVAIETDEEGNLCFETKGDNNNTSDLEYIYPSNIEGVYIYRIPRLGAFIQFLQTPLGFCLLLMLVFIIGAIIYLCEDSSINKKLNDENIKMRKQLEEQKNLEMKKQEEQQTMASQTATSEPNNDVK